MKILTILFLMLSLFTKEKSENSSLESIYDIKLEGLNGDAINLLDYKGKYILFVNVASECGFTGQYEDLQKLYETYKDKIMIIGTPCNQFGGQEPGTATEIQTFCKKNFGVTFLLTEKLDVKGENQHPLYQWLTNKSKNGKSNSTVKWNFQKYLINKNGELVDYYYSITNPLSNKILKHLI